MTRLQTRDGVSGCLPRTRTAVPGLLAAIMMTLAISTAAVHAAAIELRQDEITLGRAKLNISSAFVDEIDFSQSPKVIVFIPLNWAISPNWSNEVDMLGSVVLEKADISKGAEGQLQTAGEVTFRSPTQCPLGGPLLPANAGYQVCVPIEWSLLKCGGGPTGTAKAQLQVNLSVDFLGADSAKFTDVPVGFGVNLKVVDPGMCP